VPEIRLSESDLDHVADRIAARIIEKSITPRWLKLKTAEQYCGLNTRTLRRRIADKSVSSKIVKVPGTQRGVRLIDRISLDAFIEGCPDEASELTMNRNKGSSR